MKDSYYINRWAVPEILDSKPLAVDHAHADYLMVQISDGVGTMNEQRGIVTYLRQANRDPCGNLNTGQNSEGFLPPTGWSWTRPGLYPGAAPLTPAPRTGRSASPAGPGLPDGDATGDDD